jgi:DnaK suppressor protein
MSKRVQKKAVARASKPAKPPKKVAAKAAAKAKAPQSGSKAKAKSKTGTAGKSGARSMTARASASSIVLPPNYRPSEDEPFMNERHRIYFRQKLLSWKEEIIHQTRETLAGLHEDSTQHADLADRATSETDRALELRARDRQRKLIAKIDAALARIEDGTYGYCEETGEPIGLKRLDARPIATLSVEAQERHERRERVYRED